MKKILSLFLLILFCFPVASYAHSGGTDASGGHYNRSTGEYHYHHGYSAHQHPNGICPYDFNDNTDNNSSSYSQKTNSSSQKVSKQGSLFNEFLYSHPYASGALLLLAINILFWVFVAFILSQ